MATARAIRSTREDWAARALELAEARHLTGAASYLRVHEHGHVWRVPSRSGRGSYDVLARLNGIVECPCDAGRWGRPCSHAGSALVAEAKRKRATAQADGDVLSTWRRGGAW